MKQAEWFVYILECSDGSLYTGITNDLELRLRTHLAGKASRYTRTRLPVALVYSESQSNRSAASVREAALKALPREEKLRLTRVAPRSRANRASRRKT